MANLDDDDLDKAIQHRRKEVFKKGAGFIGECRKEVPFGEQFYLKSSGKEFISCTHTSSHS